MVDRNKQGGRKVQEFGVPPSVEEAYELGLCRLLNSSVKPQYDTIVD